MGSSAQIVDEAVQQAGAGLSAALLCAGVVLCVALVLIYFGGRG